jgi:hypothetical protein
MAMCQLDTVAESTSPARIGTPSCLPITSLPEVTTGVHSFTVTFKATGNQTITITDNSNKSISGSTSVSVK